MQHFHAADSFVFIYRIHTGMQHDAQKWLSIRFGYVL